MSYQQFRTLLGRLTFGNNSQLTNHHVPNSDKQLRQPTENSLLKKTTKKLKLNCTGLSKICIVTNQKSCCGAAIDSAWACGCGKCAVILVPRYDLSQKFRGPSTQFSCLLGYPQHRLATNTRQTHSHGVAPTVCVWGGGDSTRKPSWRPWPLCPVKDSINCPLLHRAYGEYACKLKELEVFLACS